jgi:hypothetical protein
MMGRRPDLTQNKRKKSAASTTTAQRQMDRGVAGALVSRQRLDHPRRPGAARRLRAQVPLKARREATTDDERLDAIAKLKGAAAGTDHCRKQRGAPDGYGSGTWVPGDDRVDDEEGE